MPAVLAAPAALEWAATLTLRPSPAGAAEAEALTVRPAVGDPEQALPV